MRSGIAKSIREKYPKAFDDYHAEYVSNGNKLYLGEVITTKYSDRWIFNCITQEFYGRDPNTVYVSYEAIHHAILALNLICSCKGITQIGFPMIGAGRANGDWSVIASIFDKDADFQPVVYVL